MNGRNGRNGMIKYRKTNKKRKIKTKCRRIRNMNRMSIRRIVKHRKWNMRGGLPDTLYGVVVNANNSIVVLPYRQYGGNIIFQIFRAK